MADMGGPGGDVGRAPAPARRLPWAALQSIRIIGHDGAEARIVCLHCPASRVYLARGSLAAIVRWAFEHHQFLHETQQARTELTTH